MRGSRKSLQLDGSEGAEMNLTPLIDVVFVVLILFILIAPMIDLEKVELAERSKGGPQEKSAIQIEKSLSIYVRADNTIWINKQPIDPTTLSPLLRQLKVKSPGIAATLFQDKRAQFGTYQLVKNALEESGFTSLDLILEPSK